MKVFALTLVAALVIGANGAVKLRNAERRAPLEEASAKPAEDEPITNISESDVDKKEKEVHKRGAFHYGSLAGHANPWPKSYAAHYGYGLHLPAASSFSVAPIVAGHAHAPGALRYNTGFHYRAVSSPAVVPAGAPSYSAAALPTLTSLSPTVHHAATATPFVIRPGGAVVQSYSVNYPHHKPAVSVKPVHAFASVAHLQPVQPVHTFQTVQAAAVQPVHGIQPVQSVPFHTIQAVQPAHAVQHVQPAQPIQPVQPVQSVVQTFFQAAAPAPSVPAISQVPTVSQSPAQPGFPEIPFFPNPPAFPNIPTIPASPAVPAVPNIPAFPSIPTVPSIPQQEFPTNGFFPAHVQPPLPQQPPTFINFNPAAHVPGLVPVEGTPNHNNPDFGSAEAAPQIPVQPAPLPEANPEADLSSVHPQPTQQPWKPVLHQPSPADSIDANRPSNTLLPPYGNSPAEGYLPPAPSSSNQKLQQEFAINSQQFDSLSDADIQHIFHQANLAAQRDHNHAHTVHTYRSHY